ncbi:uncharacterized protein MEPE_05420 [Melanopsichium pennsylvanicum]|uniref:Golgi to ER traffic protein 2 n=2 Tax=Melanopsichium pennsylvanicum TaxID=63383 RepID=A0AAJ4XRT1_9BASI|nr:conserved hypothetical protein [Melanopsichium pennsylvanicum 4]SNX86711.1 uncharacterized protein MEPE_05420 [Melanopsichium pennsylvanicum]
MSDIQAVPDHATAVSSPNVTTSAADVDPAEAARLKREARKARILSKGSDRLARITNTGRGEGASAYLKDNKSPLPSAPQPTSAPLGMADDDDPLEVDISTLAPQSPPRGEEATNPFAMFGGAPGGLGMNGQQNPMEALMAMMQGAGAGGGSGGPGVADGNGGQPDMSGLPPQLAAMMQQFGAGGPGGPGVATMSPNVVQTKSIGERAFDLAQALLVLTLAVVAAKSSLFDFDRSSVVPDAVNHAFEKVTPGFISSGPTNILRRWARLGYQKPSVEEWAPVSPLSSTSLLSADFLPGAMSTLPLFWIFLSLEMLLQAARIVIFSRKTPAPPSLLSTLTAMLPIPNLHLAIKLISKYLALLNAFINDVSLLMFVFGLTVLWSGYQLGGVGMLESGVVPGFVHDEL